ncbi:MAG: hypothetical protein RLZZ387_4084 [Chloroflexota bacterium]|jgi:hypothetical protein
MLIERPASGRSINAAECDASYRQADIASRAGAASLGELEVAWHEMIRRWYA